MRFPAAFALAILGLAGCGDDRPPAPSAEQNQQLDQAAAMLDNLAAEDAPPAEANRAP